MNIGKALRVIWPLTFTMRTKWIEVCRVFGILFHGMALQYIYSVISLHKDSAHEFVKSLLRSLAIEKYHQRCFTDRRAFKRSMRTLLYHRLQIYSLPTHSNVSFLLRWILLTHGNIVYWRAFSPLFIFITVYSLTSVIVQAWVV